MFHPNSYESHKSRINTFKKSMAQKIWECFYFFGPMTDRRILSHVNRNTDNLNLVSPRISELVKEGALKEVGSEKENGLTVRVCYVNEPIKDELQTELLS